MLKEKLGFVYAFLQLYFAFMRVCTRVCAYVLVCTRVCACAHVCARVYTYVRVRACLWSSSFLYDCTLALKCVCLFLCAFGCNVSIWDGLKLLEVIGVVALLCKCCSTGFIGVFKLCG